MRKLLIILFLALPSFAAITANTVWNVQRTASDTNGGGFDATISGAGTDMSPFINKNLGSCTSCQSSTVNISTTNAVTNGTTTITSSTANFSSAIVGNVIYVTGGTASIVAARYQVVTFTNSTTIVVDRLTGLTTGTGATMNIGGALATPTQASSTGVVPGNVINIKNDGTAYAFSGSGSYATAGSSGLPILYRGYTTTVGDGGRPTLQASATNLNVVSNPGSFVWFQDLIVDCNSQATTKGLSLGNNQNKFTNVKVMGCTSSTGANVAAGGNSMIFINFVSSGATSAATGGAILNNAGNFVCRGCRFTANVAPAVVVSSAIFICIDCIFDNNTGASSDGLQLQNTAATQPVVCNGCVFYLNGRDGVRITTGGGLDELSIINSLFEANVGVGLNSTVTDWTVPQSGGPDLDFNGFYNNGTARTKVSAGAHDVTYTSTAFNGAGSNDFSLTNTAGGGGLLKAVGFPGTLQSGGTGYRDIGALQSQCSAGGQRACALGQ